MTPAEGPLGTSPIEVTPPPPQAGYPRPHTVPPRPQLSYTVEQRRAIVEGLISDRENARYTGELARYRAGQTDLPPPPRPERPPTEDVAGLVAPPQPPLPEPTQQPPGLAQPDVIPAEEGYRRLSAADTELDDGGLSDFIRDMVRESGPPEDAQPLVPALVPGGQSAGASAQAEAPDSMAEQRRESAAGGFFGWLRGLFGAGEADAAAANGPGAPGPRADQDEIAGQAAGEAPDEAAAVAAPADAGPPRLGPSRAQLERVVEPSPPAPRTSPGLLQPDEAPGQP